MEPEFIFQQTPKKTFKVIIFLVLKTFLSIIFWLLTWVVAVVVLWVLALYLGFVLLPGANTDDSSKLTIIFSATILVFLFYFAIHSFFGHSTKKNFIKVGRKVLFVTILLILIGVTIATISRVFILYNVPSNLYQDGQLLSYAHQVDAKYTDNLEMKYADLSGKEEGGEYLEHYKDSYTFAYGEITIAKGYGDDQTRTFVAHEYLHHVWESRLDKLTKSKLTSQLITTYSIDTYMQNRLIVGGYSKNDILEPTELFAYYCTEASDQYLTQYELDTCNAYINRNALIMLR